jgi:hypothetical protein
MRIRRVPATVPRKNGLINDEPAKTAPNSRACSSVAAYFRNAKVAAQHDPDQSKRHRDEQRGHRRGERGREAGPPDDQDVDQPHMMGLPHRADAVIDQGADLRAALRVACGQIVEA